MYQDLEYWSMISYQERNSNRLLTEVLGVVRKEEYGANSIVDCGIELGYLHRMYHSGSGMLYIPPL